MQAHNVFTLDTNGSEANALERPRDHFRKRRGVHKIPTIPYRLSYFHVSYFHCMRFKRSISSLTLANPQESYLFQMNI